MDSFEIDVFKKSIETIITSENGECLVQDVMLTYIKNNSSDFPNLSILKDLLPIHFPVIVAHKPFNKNPVKPEQSTFFEDTIYKEKPTKKPSYGDVEGSPLKLQTYADFSAFDVSSFDCTTPKYDVTIDPEDLKFGIPLKVARKLTNIFNRVVNSSMKSVPSSNSNLYHALLCFCDGSDRKRIGCVYTQKLYSENKEYVGLKSSIIKIVDPVPNNAHLPSLKKKDFSRCQVTCKATYDILNDTREVNQLDIKDNYRYRGSLMLDVSWSRSVPNLDLLHPPPPEATTTIKANVIPGSMKSAAHSLYQELSVLRNFIEGLQSSQITWIPEEERKVHIMKSVKELFDKLKQGDAYSKESDKKSTNTDTDMTEGSSKFVLSERDNFDFTDYLWKILSNCTSYQELIDPFRYIFTALSNGELQPMVHRGNNTMVAQLVRDSFSGKLRIPNLAGLYPVELLVEIGIEKLRQDYTYAFLSKDLATRENLEPFLKSESDFSTQLVQLEKMHSVIEMIAMFQFFLQIPLSSLSAIAREMIHYYERNQISNQYIFKFIVPTSSVIKDLEGCPPSTWQLASTKLVENMKETMTYLLTSDPPFKHLPVNDTNMNMKEDVNENDTKIDDTVSAEKMKRPYFLVNKMECVSVLI
ncbi:protein zwilch homolog [Mytilus trossulus]|uniref:protein zwilch homolog n=1 Tax=Mytilus trossulus TaxID=6551 RepID=UPI003004C2DA